MIYHQYVNNNFILRCDKYHFSQKIFLIEFLYAKIFREEGYQVNRDKIIACNVIRYDARKNIFVDDKKLTSVEKFFELRLNGEHFRNFFCTPENLEDLIVGILAQADKISAVENILRLKVNGSIIKVETRECW